MIKLFTDDGADINFTTAERYGIVQLPIAVSDGENEFETGRAMDISNFYDNMRAGTVYSTSRVMPQVMEEAFRKALKREMRCSTSAFPPASPDPTKERLW